MQKFIKLIGEVANLPLDNIDTDMIIPKQFLKTITRTGLGGKLFYEMRYVNDILQPDFVLNKQKNAKILLTGKNFGCGSSREHAPWALYDFGISCVIAESFADIFYNNCFENGILPIILLKSQIAEISKFSELEIDLETQKINKSITFNIDSFKRKCLLEGLDSIGLTMNKLDLIANFESQQKLQYSWL